ncbi:MAG: iron ABC transporter permease [Candidatus Faecousia sp.]|nr:iron ABC transporter permease [Bacillota bacterium]MDY6041148.1 iron ABC transporter permease [Candidatus Faecousia sp.]
MKNGRLWVWMPVLLLISAAAGLYFGSAELSAADFFAALTFRGTVTHELILYGLRLPRVLAGILAGVGLSTAGVLLQSVTANELASPNIIGINSGAGLAVILTLTLAPKAGQILPLAAFAGAFATALCILAVANRLSGSRTAILLIGIALTTLLNAAISFLSLLDEGVLAQYNHFTVGSLKGVRMSELVLPAVIILLSFSGALLLSGRLGVLCLGDSAAAALGIRVRRLRILALAFAAAGAAAVVSYAGLLGFVGLVVPHIARRLVGDRPGRLLPAAALLGGILVVLADLLGRTLFAPSELPVGILMSLVGAPYFLVLLCRRRKYADLS